MNNLKKIFLAILIFGFLLLPIQAQAQSSCTISSTFIETTTNPSGEEEHSFRLTVQFPVAVTGFYLSTPSQQQPILVERSTATTSITTNSVVGNFPNQNTWDVFSLSDEASPLCRLTYSPPEPVTDDGCIANQGVTNCSGATAGYTVACAAGNNYYCCSNESNCQEKIGQEGLAPSCVQVVTSTHRIRCEIPSTPARTYYCRDNQSCTFLITTNPVGNTTIEETVSGPTVFEDLNPLTQFGNPDQTGDLSTPAGIVSRFLNFIAFPLAGMILFLMIVWGGFEILSQSATKKSIDAGRQRITAAIIGFVLLFSAYWIAQILEVVFGIQIL